MYCPKCKEEYRDGFYICADCQIPLVDELPQELKDEVLFKPFDIIEWEFLITVSDSFEGNSIEAFLNSVQIPVMKKLNCGGSAVQAYLGFTKTGVDIYVPSYCLENAHELISVYITTDENTTNEILDDQFQVNSDDEYKNPSHPLILRVGALILVTLLFNFYIGLIATIIFIIYMISSAIKHKK